MNNQLKFRKTLLILSTIVFFASCLKNVEETIEETPETDPCATITYALSIKPIIDNNCIQCHGTGGNFPNLTTYNGTSANANSVKAEVVSRRMPQGGSLTTTEIEAISCWVDAGALNN